MSKACSACELVAADAAGVIDPAILGARGDSDASGLKQILSGTSESARSVRAGLERRGIDLARARAVTLFGGESRPGEVSRIHRLPRRPVDRGRARRRHGSRRAKYGDADPPPRVSQPASLARAKPTCQSLWPILSRTSASTTRRPRPMSCVPANIFRSSTSPGGSAPTSSALPRASSTRVWSIRSTSPPRAR